MPAPFWTQVKARLNAWEPLFRKAVALDGHALFTSFAGIDPDLPEKQRTALVTKLLDREVTFIKYVTTCQMTRRMDEEGLDWLMNFLYAQICLYDRKPYRIARYLAVFMMEDCLNVQAALPELGDIDFADTYAGIGFVTVLFQRPNAAPWRPALARKVADHVREDLRYDYEGVSVRRTPTVSKGWLSMTCDVNVAEFQIDKAAKIRKCRELYGEDVLKWVNE